MTGSMRFDVLAGDVADVLPTLAGPFDACLCDPPYGLGFMGTAWDHGVPGADAWRLVLSLLRPGAPLLAFGGTRTFHRMAVAIEDAGFSVRDCLCWLHGQGFPKSKASLKPAWEPVIVASVPSGSAQLNVDGCRIGTSKAVPASVSRARGNSLSGAADGTLRRQNGSEGGFNPNLGRWPANVVLDEEAARALDEQTGEQRDGVRVLRHDHVDKSQYGWGSKKAGPDFTYGGNGGASRFFYTAKADTSERRIGGLDNRHPTLKPIDLCAWLAKLILPPPREDGQPRRLIVPFSGAGSEIIGALRAGWDEVVGIEREPEYAELSRARVAADAPLFNHPTAHPHAPAGGEGDV